MSQPSSALSIVIVTLNRADSLQRVLTSLQKQTLYPDEVIVIDNNSTDHTQRVISSLRKISRFPVKTFVEKKQSYPAVYNSGLKKVRYSWVIFIDDDCVAEPNWLKEIQLGIKKHSAAVFLGESKTLYPENIFSLSTYILDQYWKQNGLNKDKIFDYEILDNKNIVYNTQFLHQHHISFDESRDNILKGAAEDCDLGREIESHHGTAIYLPKAVVRHHDPTNLKWFVKRQIKSYAAYLNFQQKWIPSYKSVRNIRLSKVIKAALKENTLGGFKKISLYTLLTVVVGSSLVLFQLLKLSAFKKQFILLSEKI